MTGVEILSQNNVYETEIWWWLIGLFAGIGLLISLGFVIYDWNSCGFNREGLWLIFVLPILMGFAGLFIAVLSEQLTDTVAHIEYKVTIDDSVSMNEFLDKYEIIDQEGKIYTVKEK